MATKTEKLRKAYEFKLGKQLTDKLSDAQISLLSSYYNSLSEEEQRQIDNDIAMGKTNDLSDMAKTLIQEIEDQEEDIPEGLDDLLGDIRGTEEPPGALAIVPKSEDDLVEEEIDPQILEILGLEDVFDFTYGEYKQLLFIELQKIDRGEEKSTDRAMLLQEEFKRIKGKSGKFKVKKKKININAVLDRKQPSPPGAIVKADKLIPQPEEDLQKTEEKSTIDSENLQDDLINGIGNILESLITIRSLLQSQGKTEQQEAKEDRKETEKKKKKEREATLEKKKPKSPILKALTKPVDDFFGAIKRFFTNVLLGSVVLGLFKWLKDPKNKQAIDDFTNFIENNLDKIFNGILALIGLRIGWKIFKWTRRLYKAFRWLKRKLPKPKPPKPTTPKVRTNLGPTGSAKPGYTGPGRVRMPGQARAGGFFLEQARKAATGTSLPVAKGKDGGLLKNIKNLKNIKIGKGGWASIALGLLETEMGQDVLNIGLEKIGLGIRTYSDEKIISEINRIDEELSSAWEKQKSRPEMYEHLNKFNINLFGKYYREAIRRKLIDEDGYILDKKNESNNETVSQPPPTQPSLSPSSPNIRSGPDPNASYRKPNKSKFSSFFGSKESFRKKPHEGIDDPIPVGTELSFNQSGKILDVYRTSSTSKDAGGGYGQFVKVKLDDGKILLMAHLSEISSWVKNGAKFNANDLIAKSGGAVGSPGSGRSGGPHLHFEQHNTPGLGLEETLRGKVDPIKGGGIASLQYGGVEKTGKVEVDSSSETPLSRGEVARTPAATPTSPAQIARAAVPIPSIPSPTGRSNIIPLPIPTGGGTQQASSGTAPNQTPVPRFSSEDPNNTTTMVVRAIYNIVG